MIIDKIYEFLNLDADKGIDDIVMGQYVDDVTHGIVRQCFKKREDKRTLRLSGIGKCLRGQAYNILGYDKDDYLPPRTKMTFLFGDIIEAIIICLANHAGCDIYEQQAEVVLAGIIGHIDGIIKDENGDEYVVEVKSMSTASFDMFKRNGMTDTFGYVSQANSYAVAYGCKGIVWVGMNKNTGHLHEEVRLLDKKLGQDTVDNISALRDCITPTEFKQMTPTQETWYRKPTGNMKLDFVCSYCNFKATCFDNITSYKRKGKITHYVGKMIKCKATDGGVEV